MAEPLDALILDLLESIAPRPKPYAEVMSAWRTSCPRLPVWEEATTRGFIERQSDAGGAMVCLTSVGRSFLLAHRGGQPWGDAEKAQWRSQQLKRRSYADDVLSVIERLRARFDVQCYGELDYSPDRYALFAIRSAHWDGALPGVLVTGGVHGYETSGVHGALQFVEAHAADYAGRVNLLVTPCVSPWGYERIHRWNPNAVDPNRSFRADGSAGESTALMRLVEPLRGRLLVHVDLHETTDTDESEFRPALAARDGRPFEPGEIPDGFYLCGDSEAPEPEFQQAIIAAVAKVTHIAPADAAGQLIGSPIVAPGVIHYPYRQLGLCAGVTDARYRTTTEVYPDSPRATPEQCNAAQVAAVRAAIDFALAQTS